MKITRTPLSGHDVLGISDGEEWRMELLCYEGPVYVAVDTRSTVIDDVTESCCDIIADDGGQLVRLAMNDKEAQALAIRLLECVRESKKRNSL